MCLRVFPEFCLYTMRMLDGLDQKRVSDLLELEVQMV